MMLQSLHTQNTTTQSLRLSGFLRSMGALCNALSSGISGHFIAREQGRKPSGIIWSDSLFSVGKRNNGSYAPANTNNDDAESADDEMRKRCRSHCDRLST